MFRDRESLLNAQLKKANILVVDDFQGMRTILRNIIKDAGGINIETAANAREAINKLRLASYDIVICDYNLGLGPNGQQLLEEARLNNHIGAATIWIMVTAEKTTDMVMGAAEVKPDDYLLKPINLELLESRLEKLISRKKDLGPIEAAIKAKNYVAAIEQCDRRLKEKPTNMQDILRIKSDMLLTIGKFDEAAKLFESVLTVRDVPWAKTGLGKVHFYTKDYEAAKRIFTEVLAANRIYMEASDWLVKTLEAIGDTQQAQRALEEALSISPKSVGRQKALGEVAYANGDLDVAQTAFEKSIKFSEFSPSKSPSVFAGLAKVLTDKKSPQDALNVLTQCKREFKDNNEAALQTSIVESMVFQSIGDHARARSAANEAVRLKQSIGGAVDSALVMDMAKAMFQLGDKDAASELLKEVVKNNHDSPAVIAKVQSLFEEAKQGDEGAALIQSSKQDVIDINNQGVLLGREGKLDEAIALLRQAAKDLPNSETIMMNLCGLLLASIRKNGRSEALISEARNLLGRVQKLNPANKKQHEYVAVLATF